jgi:hypothetical protein
MTPSLRKLLLEEMPDWHQQPLNLTVAEITDPYQVLKEFFNGYHLTDIRFCLREWLGTALRTDEVMEMDYLNLHDNLVKLAEAAWLLHQKNKADKAVSKKGKSGASQKTKNK